MKVMPKIEQLRVWDFSNPATIIYKINELIDAVNKLQELARCAESSLARQSKDIDMLSETQADIEESMKNMNDVISRYVKIENSGPASTETEEATQIDNNSIKEARDMLEQKITERTIDSLLLQVSQQQEAIDDIKLQISKLWNAITSNGHYMQCGDRIGKIQTIDNQTARHESYSPHFIRSTATDTNVGTKLKVFISDDNND